ncbi:energy-coupling factor ABC transporter ATP-binding protein [Ferrimonas lipolytica]|uniref:Energy-coupling factor ABC transporter ATP-binding protein n=1 Tax=Ferrimonas lipolytica TaxID=2724191 RepID=A0A6H1UHY6_9GAMM|nr:energy-coupling factor ABC transporter ATP-binding protein [Ferrimonas lipolytica]QIZ78717.1 energy-coupling factor ABC transporter ATP-binding protein [Ferrimonas lipolytica]
MALIAQQLQLVGAVNIGPVDLHLATGQWLLLAGGNGSGKSLLSQALAGWVPQLTPMSSYGQLHWHDEDLLAPQTPPLKVQLVQASPQWSGCVYTVADEIGFGPDNLNLSVTEVEQRIETMLQLTGSSHLAARHPATLSGGEAQRVGLACALAMQPDLLILDQAFSRLTPLAHQQLLQQLKQYSQQHQLTVVLAETTLQPSVEWIDQALVLNGGTVAGYGSPQSQLPLMLQQLLCSDAWQALAANIATDESSDSKGLPLTDRQLLQWFKEHPDATT